MRSEWNRCRQLLLVPGLLGSPPALPEGLRWPRKPHMGPALGTLFQPNNLLGVRFKAQDRTAGLCRSQTERQLLGAQSLQKSPKIHSSLTESRAGAHLPHHPRATHPPVPIAAPKSGQLGRVYPHQGTGAEISPAEMHNPSQTARSRGQQNPRATSHKDQEPQGPGGHREGNRGEAAAAARGRREAPPGRSPERVARRKANVLTSSCWGFVAVLIRWL